MTLPTDFDILRPSRSIRKPCVSTSVKGGRPRVASATSSDLWNQPRCWSLPSRYMSDGQRELGRARQHRLVARARVEPDVEDVLLALERRCRRTSGRSSPSGRNSSSGRSYQASAPYCSKTPPARSHQLRREQRLAAAVQSKAGMGTPQARWREMHQSGRFVTMLRMRSRPQAGIHSPGVDRVLRGLRAACAVWPSSPAIPARRPCARTTATWRGRSPGSGSASSAGTGAANVLAVPQPRPRVQRLLDLRVGVEDAQAGEQPHRRRGSGRRARPARRSRARTSRRSGSRRRRGRARCAPRRCRARA